MKVFKKLKHFDFFRVTKNFNLAKNTADSDTENKKYSKLISRDYVGTPFGGIVTIVLGTLIVTQFLTLMSRMHNGLDDSSKINGRANHLLEGEDLIDVSKT